MIPILNFVEFVVQAVLTLIFWIVVIYAIGSWLVAFQVINLRNSAAYQVWRFLEGVATPLLRPFRRFIPSLGGVDLSAMALFILIIGLQRFLIPPFFAWLKVMALGGSVAV